ncbi:hypothetical protein SAMN06295905_3200 [Devosia lucknowensis]|uniref:Uncharacterized protein n=1 Tax=Devosia lucknowensis TaxID=1096929 RepID=A0A1Y6G700_9HYPH|nr:hypothetical protein SAMN06295905_3200 [Devosia lucknowensis]
MSYFDDHLYFEAEANLRAGLPMLSEKRIPTTGAERSIA